MKCPRTFFVTDSGGGEFKIAGAECIKMQCPWWHETTQSCEVSRIASNLSTIGNALVDIDHRLDTMTIPRKQC